MYPVIIALAVSGASAAVVSVRSPLSHPFASLLSRQTGGFDPSQIPAQCQTTCGPIVTDLQTCTTDACLCTNTVRNHFQDCMNCFISIGNGNPSIATAAQQSASGYESACQAAGQPVSPLSFSGASSATGTLGSGSASSGPTGLTSASASGANSFPSGTQATSLSSPRVTASPSGGGIGAGSPGAGSAGAVNSASNSAPTDATSGGTGNGNSNAPPLPGSAAGGASVHAGLSVLALVLGAVATMW